MIAITIGKLFSHLSKIKGGGSSLPGYMARKITPDILKKMELPKNIIMITGTNGKTSATHYITGILRNSGMKVLTNDTGANMIQGISTSIITKASSSGKIDADALVLEVDEAHLKLISEEIKPTSLVITNLFADQADRFGSPKELAELIAKTIPADTKVYLNGDDPVLCYLASIINNEKHYYGLETSWSGVSVEEKCPKCQKTLAYTSRVYDHLGKFACECGFTSPELNTVAQSEKVGEFSINGEKYTTPEDAIYFIYNSLASLALCLDMGISHKDARQVIETSLVGNGRLEELSFNGKKTFLNLVKNPAGANLSLEIISRESETYNLFFGANNEPADGTDGSWVESIAFDVLKESKLNTIYLAGAIQDELERAIKKHLPEVKIIKGDAKAMVEEMKKAGEKSYFLANFTMLAPMRKILIK